MATIRLIPSAYSVNSTNLSVSNASDMYANTDSTTYATVTNTYASVNSYYIYLKGFNFSSVPANAIVSSWTVKLKARESGISTSASYSPKLCNGTTAITSTCTAINTSVATNTFTGIDSSIGWSDIAGYGSDFGIMINCRRSRQNTTGYMYIYGAEIEVTYTIPTTRTITSTLNGSGTISPSGANTYYDNDEYTLTITPTNKAATVTVTNNNVDVTDELVPMYSPDAPHGEPVSVSAVLGTYSLISGNFSGSGATYFQGLVGKGHTATQTTTNYYSSGSGTLAVFQYAISFSNIPRNAVVTGLYMMANGHAESTSNANEYMCVQLKSGSTNLSAQYNFKSAGTSNSTQTINATTLPTREQLDDLVVECTLGYYGGAINGVTVYLEYAIPTGNPEYYTYKYTVNGDATIAVTIVTPAGDIIYRKVNGSWVQASKEYVKVSGSWREVSKVFKKVNGSWVQQDDISAMFDTNAIYKKG